MGKSFDSVEAMLDRFDFQKVQAIFELREWSYAGSPGTPLLEELKGVARDVCKRAIENAHVTEMGYAECGRFVALYFPQDEELTLNFVGESETAYV